MSDSRIVDGKGLGRSAGVDSDNRLFTYSTILPLQHFESIQNGRAFIMNAVKYTDSPNWLSVTTTGGVVGIINNKTSINLILSRIMGAATGGIIFWMHAFASAQTPAANYRSIDAKNLNFGKQKNTLIEAFGWDGTSNGMTGVTVSDESAIAQLYLPGASGVDISIDGNWVLPANSSLVIHAKAVSATVNITMQMLGFLTKDLD